MKNFINNKNTYTVVIGQIVIFTVIMGAASTFSFVNSVYAQNDPEIQSLQLEIDRLQDKYDDLKVQVATEALTKEGAREVWQLLVDDLYEKKSDVFSKKIEEVIGACDDIECDDVSLMEKISSLKKWRIAQEGEYKELCEKMEALEIAEKNTSQANRAFLQSTEQVNVPERNEVQTQKNTIKGDGGSLDEMVDACDDLDEGDSCEFTITGRDGDEEELDGECEKDPKDDELLVCIAGNMMRGMRPGR